MKTELQKEFEDKTPTIKGINGKEYLQAFCAFLENKVERLEREKQQSQVDWESVQSGYIDTTVNIIPIGIRTSHFILLKPLVNNKLQQKKG